MNNQPFSARIIIIAIEHGVAFIDDIIAIIFHVNIHIERMVARCDNGDKKKQNKRRMKIIQIANCRMSLE